jgi:hypothetical protein
MMPDRDPYTRLFQLPYHPTQYLEDDNKLLLLDTYPILRKLRMQANLNVRLHLALHPQQKPQLFLELIPRFSRRKCRPRAEKRTPTAPLGTPHMDTKKAQFPIKPRPMLISVVGMAPCKKRPQHRGSRHKIDLEHALGEVDTRDISRESTAYYRRIEQPGAAPRSTSGRVSLCRVGKPAVASELDGRERGTEVLVDQVA